MDTNFFTDLRVANTTRQDEWDPQGFANTFEWRINEFGGELGEALNVIKKLHRERCGVPGSRATVPQLAEELADVIICLDLLAFQYGFGPLHDHGADKGSYPGLIKAGALLFAFGGSMANAEVGKFHINVLTSLVFGLADAEGINLREAIVAKFNATSFKVGLKTRMPGAN